MLMFGRKSFLQNYLCKCVLMIFLVGALFQATNKYKEPTLKQFERSYAETNTELEIWKGRIGQTSNISFEHSPLVKEKKMEENEREFKTRKHPEQSNKTRLKPVSKKAPPVISRKAYHKQHPRRRKRLPQAMIIGVKKCGTQALTDMLDLHPLVRIVPGEMRFFTGKYENGLEWYRKQMIPSLINELTMEKSGYFTHLNPEVPARVRAMNASILLIVIIKEPVNRAVSEYVHTKLTDKQGMKVDPFEEVILTPDGQVRDWEHILERGMYADHLTRWLKEFKLHQIHFVDGDKLITDPVPEIIEVQKFLKLPQRITEKNFYFSKTKGFYCLRNLVTNSNGCLEKTKGRKHPDVDPAVISRLRKYFQPFNEQFYKMVGRDFHWPTS